MTIGRAKKFALLVGDKFNEISEHQGAKLGDIDLAQGIVQYTDLYYGKLAEVWNYVFEFENDEYKPIDQEWLENNVKISTMQTVGKEIARLNRMSGILPFFQARFRNLIVSSTIPEPSP